MTIRELIEQAKAEEFVTATQLALLLNVCPETIWRAVRSGRVPALHVGRDIRIHREHGLAAFHRRGNARQQQTTGADTTA